MNHSPRPPTQERYAILTYQEGMGCLRQFFDLRGRGESSQPVDCVSFPSKLLSVEQKPITGTVVFSTEWTSFSTEYSLFSTGLFLAVFCLPYYLFLYLFKKKEKYKDWSANKCKLHLHGQFALVKKQPTGFLQYFLQAVDILKQLSFSIHQVIACSTGFHGSTGKYAWGGKFYA